MLLPCPVLFHAARCASVSLPQRKRARPKRTVVVVIPVEDKGIDSIIGGRIDLLGHYPGIRLVRVAPQRDFGLLVSGEARLGFPDEVPLGEPGILRLVPARIGVLARVVIGGNGDVAIGGRSITG